MARTKIPVDAAKLQETVSGLEANRTFVNQSALFQAVAETEWAKGLKLTPAVIYLRVREFKTTCKTLPGKKGGVMTQERIDAMRAGRGTRQPRSEKMKGFADSFEKMRKAFPAKSLPIIEKAEQGSLRAAIKLMCLDCSGQQAVEVRNCVCPGCPLFPHRPYQGSVEEVEVEDSEEKVA